jgi:hypothetical protein
LSGANIQLNDQEISDTQFQRRKLAHLPSSKYAPRNGKPVSLPALNVGDLVYVRSERSKSKARDSYFILQLDDEQQLALVQKFPMSNFKHHPINLQFQNLYHVTPPTEPTPSPPSNISSPAVTKPRVPVPGLGCSTILNLKLMMKNSPSNLSKSMMYTFTRLLELTT